MDLIEKYHFYINLSERTEKNKDTINELKRFGIREPNRFEAITHEIGIVLYTDYIHLFQLSGMVLLVAMIGAIVLTFRQREGIKRQSYLRQISRERNEGVELTDPKNNEGVKIDV